MCNILIVRRYYILGGLEIELQNPENDSILKKHSIVLNEMWVLRGQRILYCYPEGVFSRACPGGKKDRIHGQSQNFFYLTLTHLCLTF